MANGAPSSVTLVMAYMAENGTKSLCRTVQVLPPSLNVHVGESSSSGAVSKSKNGACSNAVMVYLTRPVAAGTRTGTAACLTV